MNSQSAKYLALVLELPALMLVLAYLVDLFDGPQHGLGGYGKLIGLISALILWLVHVLMLAKKSDNG